MARMRTGLGKRSNRDASSTFSEPSEVMAESDGSTFLVDGGPPTEVVERGRVPRERRRFDRAHLGTLAILMDMKERVLGQYVVQDVSVGGLLLTGGPRLASGMDVRVALELPDDDGLRLQGRVCRTSRAMGLLAIGVRFNSLRPDDLATLRASITACMIREWHVEDPAVLVLEDCATERELWLRRVRGLGYRVMGAASIADAWAMLDDPQETFEACLLSAELGAQVGPFMARLTHRYPFVRCVVVTAESGWPLPYRPRVGVDALFHDGRTARETLERLLPRHPLG